MDADRGREIARPHAGGEHHRVGHDHILADAYAGHPLAVMEDFRHLGILADHGAAGARTLGERLRYVDGIGLAVGRNAHRTDHIIDGDQRIALLDLFRRHHIDLEIEHLGHGGVALELLEAALMGGDGDRAALFEAGRLAGLGLEIAIELGGVFGELSHAVRATQLADQPGGVPGGAAGKLAAFQQHRLGNAELGQVIGDRAADHPAADNDDLGRARQVLRHGPAQPAGASWRISLSVDSRSRTSAQPTRIISIAGSWRWGKVVPVHSSTTMDLKSRKVESFEVAATH